MLIGKILALANLAATCENEMTSSLGLILYNAWKFANFCTGTGNLFMCKSKFAPVLAFNYALNRQYASDQICECIASYAFNASARLNVWSRPAQHPVKLNVWDEFFSVLRICELLQHLAASTITFSVQTPHLGSTLLPQLSKLVLSCMDSKM